MKKIIMMQASVLAVAFVCIFAVSQDIVSAQGKQGNGMPARGGMNGNERGGIRQGEGGMGDLSAATSACTDKSEKDTCSFSTTRKTADSDTSGETVTISGTCTKAPAKSTSTTNTLMCMPTRKLDGTGSDVSDKRGERVAMSTLERAQAMKTSKKAEIYRIETRTEKVITFLDSKDVADMTLATLRGYSDVFDDKADTLLEKLDAYITLLEDTDASDTDKATALAAVKTASQDMMTYYTGTLRVGLKDALDDLAD